MGILRKELSSLSERYRLGADFNPFDISQQPGHQLLRTPELSVHAKAINTLLSNAIPHLIKPAKRIPDEISDLAELIIQPQLQTYHLNNGLDLINFDELMRKIFHAATGWTDNHTYVPEGNFFDTSETVVTERRGNRFPRFRIIHGYLGKSGNYLFSILEDNNWQPKDSDKGDDFHHVTGDYDPNYQAAFVTISKPFDNNNIALGEQLGTWRKSGHEIEEIKEGFSSPVDAWNIIRTSLGTDYNDSLNWGNLWRYKVPDSSGEWHNNMRPLLHF